MGKNSALYIGTKKCAFSGRNFFNTPFWNSKPSLVGFTYENIVGIISFVFKSNLMKMQLLISILCYDLCNCNFHFQCHKSYFEVPNKSEDDDSLITEK